MKHRAVFVADVVALLLAFVFATLYYSIRTENKVLVLTATNSAALIRMHSPNLGRIDAPVVIVEFFDPACETCRVFYPMVKEIMAANPDRIRLVLRDNPFHKGSDQVIALLEAVCKQGKVSGAGSAPRCAGGMDTAPYGRR